MITSDAIILIKERFFKESLKEEESVLFGIYELNNVA